MSYCSCDFEPVDFYHKTWVAKCRKATKCQECYLEIPIGQPYEKVVAVWDGEFSTFKTCERCADLRDSLVGDGGCVSHGNLKDEYSEYLSGLLDEEQAQAQYKKIFRR